MKIRVGFGYDVHQLAENQDFFIGGVQIPHSKGAVGHSDADVLIHAICDALLGAAGMGDIGTHFPDTSPEFKGIDSKLLLTEVLKKIQEKGYTVGNIDATVCLERPKLKPHIPSMKKVLSEIVQSEDISIKATTSESMGFVGREEGVAAYAVVLIEKN